MNDFNTKYTQQELATFLNTWADDSDPSDHLDVYWAEQARECANDPELKYSTVRSYMRKHWIASKQDIDADLIEKHKYASEQFSKFLQKYF